MSKKFLIITSVLAIVGIIFQLLLAGVLSSVQSVLQSIVLWFLVSLFGIFFRGKRDFIVFVKRYGLIFLSLSWVFSLFLLLLATLSNLFPASLSEITLSNGKSTIVFVEMSHIATEKYYREVNTRLRSLAGSGYTLYLEWVRPGTPENSEKFQKLLGIRLESDTYSEIARIFGLTAQEKSLYDGISTGSLIGADISIDDIMAVIGTGKVIWDTPPADIGTELEKLSLGDSPLFHFIVRGILNLSLRASTNTDILMDSLDQDLIAAILDRRNAHVVSLFKQRNDTKAVFVYGALHFDGIYTLLRQNDPNWNIIDFSPLYPYVH